jgi:ribA/ribD-fused uncharacterized protein
VAADRTEGGVSSGPVINNFYGANRIFSNFSAAAVVWGDNLTPTRTWPCVEVPYQLAKSQVILERDALLTKIRQAAAEAKEDGRVYGECVEAGSKASKQHSRSLTLRPGWEDFKVTLMFGLVFDKIGRSTSIQHRLLATGSGAIVEGNLHGDTFWGIALKDLPRRGVRSGDGENWLGRIWMEGRDILRQMGPDALMEISAVIRGEEGCSAATILSELRSARLDIHTNKILLGFPERQASLDITHS